MRDECKTDARAAAGKEIQDKLIAMQNELEVGQNPFERIQRRLTSELTVEGSAVKYTVKFSELKHLPALPLMAACFNVGSEYEAPGEILQGVGGG